jgi:hypothetical protein
MDTDRHLRVKLSFEENEWFLHIYEEGTFETFFYYPLIELVEDVVSEKLEVCDRQEAFESLISLADELVETGNNVKQRVFEEVLNADMLRNLGETN